MPNITSSIINNVQNQTKNYAHTKYTSNDVQLALNKDTLSFAYFAALLSPAAEEHLEAMARRAQADTRRHFGTAISLYTPLYIANYCQNHCVYCGFNSENQIARAKLTLVEIDQEMQRISATGLREILLLTGEDRIQSSVEYIGTAVKIATNYFSTIGLEIYPLEIEEYAYLQQCGADFVSIYQETYDPVLYSQFHLQGPKKDYNYRFEAQERAIQAGMRGVSFGVLLGLGDFRQDAFATGLHAYLLQQKYPHAEINFSVPRLREFINQPQTHNRASLREICEKHLLQVMLAYRIFMPFASITISTRERPVFRDNVIGLVANKISAEVNTSVANKSDAQFEIADTRNVNQIHTAILNKGLQPVYADFIRI